MKLKSVTIVGFHNVDRVTYEFNDLTYFKGHNAAGKSTALQAVQLALLGYIPGTSKNSKEALFHHANSNVMMVSVELDDNGEDVTLTRSWTKTGSKILNGVDIQPEGYDYKSILSEIELPIFNFNEFIGLSSNKMKEWFINFLPSISAEINWKDELSQQFYTEDNDKLTSVQENIITQICNEAKQSSKQGLDQVVEINKYIKQAVSFKKKELARSTEGIQSLVRYDDIDPTLSEQSIVAEMNNVNNNIRLLGLKQSAESEYNLLKQKLSEFQLGPDFESDTLANMSKSQITENEARLKVLQDTSNEIHNKVAELQAEYKLNKKITDSKGICPITNATCESITSSLDDINKKQESIESELADLKQKEYEARKEYNEVTNKINELKTQLYDLQYQYSRREQVKEKLESISIPKIDDSITIDSCNKELQKLQEQLAQVKANLKYDGMIDVLTKQKYELDQQLEVYKVLEKHTGVNGMQSTFNNSSDSPFVKFGDEMNRYIKQLFGEDCETSFNIASKANSFNFGLIRKKKYIPYDLLSSGEKCMFMLALFICLTKNSHDKLKLILVDDLFDHLDDQNIIKLFKELLEVEGIQMIFAGVKDVDIDEKFIIELGGNK